MSPTPRQIEDLPALADHVEPEVWAQDVVAASAAVQAATHERIFRDRDGGLTVLGHRALRELAEHPDVGNTPRTFLESRAADRARRKGTAVEEGPAPFTRFLHNQVFTHNPPVHTASRRLVGQPLLPRRAADLGDAAARTASHLLADLAERRTVDLVHDFAGPYVCRFWAEQLGMPSHAAEELPEVMDAMNAMFLFDPAPDDVARLRAATARYVDLVSDAIDASATSTAITAYVREHLDRTEGLEDPVSAGRFIASNYFDGFHTAGVAVASTLKHLLDSPESLRQVREDPGLAANAFQEATRLATPVMVSTRLTSAEVTLDDVRIPSGTPLAMVWAAGNRDPDVYDDPHTFDLHRGGGLGMTFGGGIHLCPGRNVAKMLAEAAVTALIDARVRITPIQPSATWIPGSAMRVLASLPVAVSSR